MERHRAPALGRVIAVLGMFAALLALQVGVATPVGAAQVASISGTIVSTAGNPLADICVNVVGDDGDYLDGTASDVDGTYWLEVDSGVEMRVQFFDCSDHPVWFDQWYPGAPDFDEAEPVVLGESEELTGVDAQLSSPGSVSGTVSAPSVGPVGDICVFAEVGDGDGRREVSEARTAPDGTYTLGQLPAGAVRVLFEDCEDVGRFADQWFDGATSRGEATVIEVAEGSHRTGVDAVLQPAAVISGTVSGPDGQPLADVCVQAVSAERLGGSERTDDDGFYAMKVTLGGTYRVQFVDCDGDPTHAGRWFGGSGDPSTAQPIEVPAGGTVKNISATLALGSGASLSGTASNIRGEAMTTACAVLYLADEFVDFRAVSPDGAYSFDGFGSGTYAVAFIGCADAGDEDGDDGPDAQMTIPDPGASGVSYQARWRGGEPLLLEDDEAPDPILQGADLLTVGPGEAAEVDECFGCGVISLQLTPTSDSIAADFTVNGLSATGPTVATADGPGEVGAAALGLEYSLLCRSDSPGVGSERVSVSGTTSPLVATDLDEGSAYTCSVSATSNGLLVADSEVFGISTVAPVTPPPAAPAATPSPRSTAAGTPSTAAVPRQLAFAG